MSEILAGELAEKMGSNLLGREVMTPAVGEYPGGLATVIELAPDPNAPEIVFNVRLEGWGEIGVFEHEAVVLQPHESGGR